MRERLFALMQSVCTKLALEHPTLLVIEDLHWADATSIDLLEHLVPLTAQVPLVVVGVLRLRPYKSMSKLLGLLERRYADRFLPIALAPLSPNSSLRMVEQVLSVSELPKQLQSAILSKAEGDPFFVEEVIRALIDRGVPCEGKIRRGLDGHAAHRKCDCTRYAARSPDVAPGPAACRDKMVGAASVGHRTHFSAACLAAHGRKHLYHRRRSQSP